LGKILAVLVSKKSIGDVMNRNFGCESNVNVLWRAQRAFMGRLRGKIYKCLGVFHKDTSCKLYFGWGARFINSKSIKLSENVKFGMMARIECHGLFDKDDPAKIIIGPGSSFGDYCHIGALNRIIIGENVLGGSGVTIIDHNHGSPKADLSETHLRCPKQRPLVSKAPITIGDNAWIGDGVIILSGSEIGSGAIIAANVVVTGTVLAKTVYLGKK